MIFKQQIVNYSNSISTQLNKIFANKNYAIYFSLLYAILWTFNFYPGILYSDSVPRWNLAIEIANNGFEHIQNFSNHHPVIPSIFQAFFYKISHDVGLYIFTQVFMFSFALFYFVHSFSKSKIANILISLLLFLPVNVIYSLFHSFDSMFAIFLLLFVSVVLRLGERKLYYILLPILFFFMVSTRLNAIVLVVPTIIYILYLYRLKIKKALVLSMSLLVFSILPFVIVSSLHMKPSNSWVIGFAWEYANFATKSSDKSNQEYLVSVGSNVEKIKNNINYHGMWGGAERVEFINKVSHDNNKTKEVAKHYIQFVLNEPLLFLKEKIKYISSLYGYSRPISNSEIAKWRHGNWAKAHAKLGFHSTEHKENIIDNYFEFSNENTYMFKPYLLFIIFFLLTLISFVIFSRKFSYAFLVAYLYSLFYYATFIITSQNHEFRYFFPSYFILEGLLIVFLVQLYKKNKLYTLISVFVIVTIFIGNNFFKNIEKSNQKISNLLQKERLVDIDIKDNVKLILTDDSKLIYYISDCKPKDTADSFFLHLYPEDTKDLKNKKHSFNNFDFKWEKYKIEKSWFSNYSDTCIVVKELPLYNIDLINTGRYKGPTRFWQKKVDLKALVKKTEEIVAFNLSDSSLNNGISKTKPRLFIENNIGNRFSIKENDILKFPFSGERKIIKITISNKYINIDVNGSKLYPMKDGYPNQIKIIKGNTH